MKIKTKRGARRIRNQRVIDRRFVVTDYTGCSYVTAGKLYRVFEGNYLPRNSITDDVGDEVICIPGRTSLHFDQVAAWRHPIR